MIFAAKEFLKMPEITVRKSYIDDLKYKISKLQDTISFLKQENRKLQEDRDHAEFRIRTELEPRIQQERTTYDFWAKQQTGEEQCDYFCSTIDKLCNYVDEQNESFFDWEWDKGDLYEMILFLIKNREEIDEYRISEEY